MNKINKAYFAGGCFWCTEHDLQEIDGVIDVISGYAGDADFSPSYENHRGFREAVEVTYDSTKTSFKKLCQFFLDHIDPTDSGGQFFDRGESYKTAIYYLNDSEKNVAESVMKELNESGVYDSPSAVEILSFPKFFKAEEYHQQYARKNPTHYNAYREGSGKNEFIAKTCAIRDQKKIPWSN